MLALEGLHKRFGDLHVLRGIDMQVERGQVVCVIGPSGSGKSTLLRCINLLEPPDEGRILLEGRTITGGELNRYVNVYLNDEDVRVLQGLETEVGDSDVLVILPAMAGGA